VALALNADDACLRGALGGTRRRPLADPWPVSPGGAEIERNILACKTLARRRGGAVDADGRVLLAQRPPGKQLAGLWEFPGGKIDAGERPEQALARELGEELGIDACVSCMQPLAFASHAYEDFHLLMPLFVCRRWDGLVSPREGQALHWARPRDLRKFPMPPADAPLIDPLIALLG